MPQQADQTPSPPTGWQRNFCFGCGPENASGLRLHFEIGPSGDSYRCEFTLASEFGGPPGHAHGGIIATILDEAMSKANRLKGRVAMTRRMLVEYLRPVPLNQPLIVEGRIGSVRGRASFNHAELRNAQGAVLARSRGKFLAVDAEKMFARELQEEKRARR
jgi:uncharacterized protein (TIGR00369 family)